MIKKKFVQGIIKRHPDGFGFLIADDPEQEDVYIPHHSMNGAMSNDRVLAEVVPEKGSDRFRGEIVRITQRGTKKIVGHLSWLNESQGVVKDESHSWGEDLRVKRVPHINAKNGDLVVAAITTYPEEGDRFTGEMIEVIGDIQDPMNDIRRVIHAHHLPYEFPAAVIEESKQFGPVPTEKDFAGRRDLRSKNLITIDGATAKDFDDAVYVEMTPQGFRLFVAIADVSHYVQPGTAIDKEAFLRGTSVYFPNFVIPMLPESLSNGLCSLNPHVPRLCLVAEMLFDYSGVQQSAEFYEAVMESKARVTYGQAQEVIDGTKIPELEHVRETILRCSDLAKILMAKRFREGSLDLEIPETQLQIDGSGRPVDVIRSERLFAHRLIEEMMLAANVAVAKFLSEKEIPALYRIHEPPHEDALRLLEKYMHNFGSKARLEGGNLQKRLTRALEDFGGKPEAQVLHILTLRSMSQAKYSPQNVGHFGLGFENYTHFTSPIRRYPDLIVHRLLKNQIMPNSRYRLLSAEDLATAGTMLSACEQRSVKAERQLMAIKKARFMQSHVGETFEGLVSSVARFGAFVLLREYDIDGLVRCEEMANGPWEYDEDNLRLVSRSSKQQISLGDNMKISVAAVDTNTGQITFVPADRAAQNHRPAQKSVRGLFQRKSAPKERQQEKSHPTERRKNDRRGEQRGRRQEDQQDGQQSAQPKAQNGKISIPSSSRSRKLQFADRSKLNSHQVEKKSQEGHRRGEQNPTQSNRQDAAERGSSENHRGGVRKTRPAQRSGKSAPGKVSDRKARRKRRR